EAAGASGEVCAGRDGSARLRCTGRVAAAPGAPSSSGLLRLLRTGALPLPSRTLPRLLSLPLLEDREQSYQYRPACPGSPDFLGGTSGETLHSLGERDLERPLIYTCLLPCN